MTGDPRDSPEGRLLRHVVEHLDYEVYELHGEPWSDAWGASQWVVLTEPDGSKRYMQISVAKQ